MNTVTSHTSNSSRSPHLEALRADTSNRGRLLLAALDQIVSHMRAKGGAWFATRRQIAEHFTSSVGRS